MTKYKYPLDDNNKVKELCAEVGDGMKG
jgi:hypothetical protein